MKNDQLEKEGDTLEVKVGRIHQDYHTTVVSAVKHKMWSISRRNSQKGNRNLRNKTFLIYIFFLIWEQKINIFRVIGNLSAFTVTWENLPKFLTDGSSPA